MSIEIIAEIGENHLGDMILAKELINRAKLAGVDAVKFQSYNMDCIRDDDPEREWFRKVQLSDDDHFKLKKYADEKGIKFLSSPFSVERLAFLVEGLNLREIKIASPLNRNRKFLDAIRNYIGNGFIDKVYYSTGNMTVPEIVGFIDRYLSGAKSIVVLHCVSRYPCAHSDTNLKRIKDLKKIVQWKRTDNIGYSDHTIGILACVGAMFLGAKVIEKHFTIDKNFEEGTDHILSANMEDLRQLVLFKKKINKMMIANDIIEPPSDRFIV